MATALGAALLVVPACSHACSPPAGGRCPGPVPLTSVGVDDMGRHLSVFTLCGGRLHAKESRDAVTVTYVASRVGAGAMSCACITLRVTLSAPVGRRAMLDGVTHRPLTLDHRSWCGG